MANYNNTLNINVNFSSVINEMTEKTTEFITVIERSTSSLESWAQKLSSFDLLSKYFSSLSNFFSTLSTSGVQLDKELHELSAITGITGESLKEIEGFARDTAKAFGVDAAQAVEIYKLLLSQLSPELGKYPDVLKAMGDNVATVAKLMGGDGVAAAEVLTTAMNQYGVSLDNPTRASQEMARMMNVMAAAARAGSAELPAIKVALEASDMAAKVANISFEETNAAIQVLDRAGRKGAEGGIALRDVLTSLSRGKFLPESTQEELLTAGIDVDILSDKSLTLRKRLETLQPVLNNNALLSQIFGSANASSARALIQGTEALGEYTEAVTGTESAVEQADAIMESFEERQARLNARFEDLKISLFEATGEFGMWVNVISSALVPISQLIPLMTGVWQGLSGCVSFITHTAWPAFITVLETVTARFKVMVAWIRTEGVVAMRTFLAGVWANIVALARFAVTAIGSAVKGIAAWVASLFTGGVASVAFSTTASVAFGAFAVVARGACAIVSSAIKSIPIVGWVIAIVSAIGALIAYFYKTSTKFRGFLAGLWSAIKEIVGGIWNFVSGVFGGIAKLIGGVFTGKLFSKEGREEMRKTMDDIVEAEKHSFDNVGDAYREGRDEKLAKDAEEGDGKKRGPGGLIMPDDEEPEPVELEGFGDFGGFEGMNPVGGTLSAVGTTAASSGGDAKIKNITITIDKLVERFEINTTNMTEDLSKVKDMVTETLLGALNDVNLAM